MMPEKSNRIIFPSPPPHPLHPIPRGKEGIGRSRNRGSGRIEKNVAEFNRIKRKEGQRKRNPWGRERGNEKEKEREWERERKEGKGKREREGRVSEYAHMRILICLIISNGRRKEVAWIKKKNKNAHK